jgi:hypothetical protein
MTRRRLLAPGFFPKVLRRLGLAAGCAAMLAGTGKIVPVRGQKGLGFSLREG